MGQPTASFTSFIDDVRALYRENLPEDEHWKEASRVMKNLVGDPTLREHSETWPVGQGRELILHHDREFGFFVGGLVRHPWHKARAHDHAHTWTVYGVVYGEELTTRYERLDDGSVPGKAELRKLGEFPAPAGAVDVVKPWEIHTESNEGDRSVAVTLRSEIPGNYNQNMFDPKAGTTHNNHRGLELIPFEWD